MPRYVLRPFFGGLGGDEGVEIGPGVEGREGAGDSGEI